jgi:hypothetical protein
MKIWGNSMFVFDLRKLIKIARNGIKLQEFAWRYEIQFGTLFMFASSSKSPRTLNYSKDFRKTDLNESWSDRLIEILIPNPLKLYFGQEVLHCDLQRLEYDLGDR